MIINPTLKNYRARSLTHSFGWRTLFTSLTEGKGQPAWGGPGMHGNPRYFCSWILFFFFPLAVLEVELGAPCVLSNHRDTSFNSPVLFLCFRQDLPRLPRLALNLLYNQGWLALNFQYSCLNFPSSYSATSNWFSLF